MDFSKYDETPAEYKMLLIHPDGTEVEVHDGSVLVWPELKEDPNPHIFGLGGVKVPALQQLNGKESKGLWRLRITGLGEEASNLLSVWLSVYKEIPDPSEIRGLLSVTVPETNIPAANTTIVLPAFVMQTGKVKDLSISYSSLKYYPDPSQLKFILQSPDGTEVELPPASEHFWYGVGFGSLYLPELDVFFGKEAHGMWKLKISHGGTQSNQDYSLGTGTLRIYTEY